MIHVGRTTHRNHDTHRRDAEKVHIKNMIAREKQNKLNAAQWLRMAVEALQDGDHKRAHRLIMQAQMELDFIQHSITVLSNE